MRRALEWWWLAALYLLLGNLKLKSVVERSDVSERQKIVDISRNRLGGNSRLCREVRKVSRYLHRGEERAHANHRSSREQREGKVNCKMSKVSAYLYVSQQSNEN